MAIVDPATRESWFISDFVGIPEAAAFAPDGETLFIVKQEDWQADLMLDQFAARAEEYTPDVYTFSPMMQWRTAIDAKIGVRPGGVFADARSLLGPRAGGSLGKWFAQLALIGLGVALWRRDGKTTGTSE